MSATNQIELIRRQAMRHKYEDGFVEMSMGIIYIASAIFLIAIFAAEQAYALIIAFCALVAIFSGAFVVRHIVKNLKEQVTYPRTGYVEYSPEKRHVSRWLEIVLALSLVGVAFVFYDTPELLAFFNGLVLAISIGYKSWQANLKRLSGVAGLAFLFGILFAVPDLSVQISYIGPVMGTGLALIISGTMAFRDYLQTYAVEE